MVCFVLYSEAIAPVEQLQPFFPMSDFGPFYTHYLVTVE